MEQKKSEIQKTIDCIRGILARTDGQPDWIDVAEIARNIRQDQSADEYHFYALKHTANAKDWYECIYDLLDINQNSRVLDIGCGFGKLWRNNWNKIPEGITINGIDLHGSWADDFQKYISENKKELSNNTSVSLYWGDVENEDIWNEVSNILDVNKEDNTYDYVIAHYIVEIKSLDNSMRYDNADEVFEKLCKTYPENIKYIKENESAIKAYFEDILQEKGEIIVSNSTEFWRCKK
jgi:SAM-dependent methyltransferase